MHERDDSRRRARRGVDAFTAAGGALCVLYALITAFGLGGTTGHGIAVPWVYDASLLCALCACVWRAKYVREARAGWAAIAVALACWIAGDAYWYGVATHMPVLPYPSWSDALYLLFFPAVLFGLVVIVRARTQRPSAASSLDGITAGCALGALAAGVLLDPILDITGGDFSLVATSLAYPVGDLMLLTVVGGAWVAHPGVRGADLLALLGGLLLVAAADLVYLIVAVHGGWSEGSPLDALWPAAALLIALAARSRERPVDAVETTAWRPQVLSMGFVALALVLLVLDAVVELNWVADALLTVALAASLLRFVLALRENLRLADSRTMALTDDLTGLANRRSFYAVVDEADLAADNHALLLLDLDRFKELNDTLGHHAGDELLIEVGHRLRAALPDALVLARLGGDEFVALLAGGATEALTATDAIARALERPIEIEGVRVHGQASTGIALAPEHGTTRAALLRGADVAMYRAKQRGTAVEVYVQEHDRASRATLELSGELREGIGRGELEVQWQPKAELATGAVTSAEALVRWRHPVHGLLAPGQFLALAERSGAMRALTLEVLDAALAQQADWRGQGRDLAIAVNVSASDLLHPDFVGDVTARLDRHGVVGSSLLLELTENTIVADPLRVTQVLTELSDRGIDLSLDDFGTGYSSLAQLKQLPVRELKIDRSFTANMLTDHGDATIVRSIIGLGCSLGLRVVAEGVECEQVWDRLRDWGCHVAQGFLLARPLPVGEFEAWLDARALVKPSRPRLQPQRST